MKPLIKRVLFILFLSFSCLNLNGQARDLPVLRDTIRFEVGTDIIIPDSSYLRFIEKTLPYLEENQDRVEEIHITGSTSPEGTLRFNEKLAIKRASKVQDLLKSYSIEKTTVVTVGNSNFSDLRAVYVETILRLEPEKLPEIQTDTVYVYQVFTDIVYTEKRVEKRPIFSIKTNALADLLLTPNVQAEVYTWLWGIGLEFEYTFPWWSNDSKFIYYQVLNGAAGIKKYWNSRYSEWYSGIYGNTGYYDISVDKNKGWQGEEYGAGISFGYVFTFKRYSRIRIEPYIRVGWVHTTFDKYYAGCPFEGKYYYYWDRKASDFVPRRFEMNYFGPTMIGINISIDLLFDVNL